MAQEGSDGGNSQTPEQQNARVEAERPAEELRQLNLTRILTPEAKDIIGQYALLKPNMARLLEDSILKRAEKGHITSKVSNEKFISALEKIITRLTKETKVTGHPELETIRRREMAQQGSGGVDQEFKDFVRQRLLEIKAERDGEMDNLQTPEQREAKRAAEEFRQLTLTRMLTPKAKETLGQFALLRPNNARFIEDDILRRAEKGLTICESANATLVRVLEKIITKGNRPTPEQRKARAKRRAEELRQLNLTRIMTPEAKERLARMAVKQPIKTRVIEDAILKYAEKGVRTKLSDEKLISLLEAMHTKAAAEKIRSALESTHI